MAASSTFFSQQAANRRKSALLLASVGLILGALGFSIGVGVTGDAYAGLGFTAAAVAFASILGVSSYFAGDRMVLAASKATPVTQESHPMLMNVVREMSLAANVPMPKVYLIPDT